MKLIALKFVFFLLWVCFYFVLPSLNPIFASHKIFRDDFNSYLPGTEDLKRNWKRIDDQWTTSCNAQWEIKDGQIGISINQHSCTTNLVPEDSVWNNLGDNYIFDVDIKFIKGTDHNIAFRFVPDTSVGNDWYELHFQLPGDFSLDRSPPGTFNLFLPKTYYNGNTYHLRIIVNGTRTKVYVDGELVRDFIASTDWFPHGKIALRAGAGGDPVSETWFDNIVVTSIDHETNLNVPPLKQTDPAWGGLLYDFADKWAPFLTPPQPTDISTWGCALTSAAMVFQSHGITKMPDGSNLNPETLNNWLINRKDGYVNGGNVNWVELATLSSLAIPQNPNLLFNSLEYFYANPNDELIREELENQRPVILQVPGHYVVAKGVTNESFSINDPFYNRSSLADYGDSYLSMRRYIPSNSDLSYIIVSTQDSVNIELKDSNSNSIGVKAIEHPIANPKTGKQSGPPVKVIYFSKPSTGDYKVNVSSESATFYDLEILSYNIEGEHKKFVYSGIVGQDNNDVYSISFDKDNLSNNSSKEVVTFDSLINDIRALRATGNISSLGVYISLLTKANVAKGLSGNVWTKKASINLLKSIQQEITKQKGKGVSGTAYQILNKDIEALLP